MDLMMEKKYFMRLICILVISLSFAFTSNAEEVWVNGLITATGTGMSTDPNIHLAKAKVRAFNAAKASAQVALYASLESMVVNKKLLSEDSEQVANIIVTKTKGLLRGAFVFDKQLTIDNGAPVSVVTMAVCAGRTHPACKLRPTFSSQLGSSFYELEKTKSSNRIATSVNQLKNTPKRKITDSVLPEVIENQNIDFSANDNGSSKVGVENAYDENDKTTGLIVGIHRLLLSAESKTKPVVAVRESDEGLRILYSITKMSEGARLKYHPAIFTTNAGLKQDFIASRVGSNTLYLPADSIVKDQYGDEIVLISSKGAKALSHALSLDDEFLKSASVAFITD